MRKIAILTATAAMALSLSACKGKEEAPAATEASSEAATTEASAAPAADASAAPEASASAAK